LRDMEPTKLIPYDHLMGVFANKLHGTTPLNIFDKADCSITMERL
jgi:hypothetical protein